MSYNTSDNVLQKAQQLGVGGSTVVQHITANTTLDKSQTIVTTEVPAASSITLTLPALNDQVRGRVFDISVVTDNGGTSVIITDQGDATVGKFTAVLIDKGDRIRISSDGYRYFVTGGTRMVTDAGPMSATPGVRGELAYNTSDSKAYVCTATSASAGTWSALN